MLELLDTYEKWIYRILIALLAVVIAFAVIELVLLVIYGIIDDRMFRLENHEILGVFGAFLLILIGVELLETIRAYVEHHEVRVEVILLVAIIAIARKIILFDSTDVSDLPLIGLALLLTSLVGGYYIILKAKRLKNEDSAV
ncbi:phosphate-starvation-inducible PsiE family protein [Methanofollis fontis]|uniref:Phosphate-starvation-inducible E-like protein n=1 Tax=Methanofollis fontis TaxID=2052832 RepID=A0A483CMH1_9EURY|nr:phosphate-starvation-inducible PsiE family protein [Methanofollis fontis]TAJ44087.1 hypothetical protein CUJ86_08630 [Methanofollis fontis]